MIKIVVEKYGMDDHKSLEASINDNNSLNISINYSNFQKDENYLDIDLDKKELSDFIGLLLHLQSKMNKNGRG